MTGLQTDPQPSLPVFPGRRACVIGAGLGGLALAVRLQAAGIETVLVEAGGRPGGHARGEERDGFVFDSGPGALADPAALGELWALGGEELADHVELLAVQPLRRFSWPDGATFDLAADEAALTREIARFAPEDLGGYEDYARYAASAHDEVWARFGQQPMGDPLAMARALPALARHQAWRGLDSLIAAHIASPHLREALSYEALLVGGNPLRASAVHAALHRFERAGGLWWPKGGMGALAGALAALFERLGGKLRLHDPALHIHMLGNRASEVETQSGWKERFDAVASNADVVHTYRDLLGESAYGTQTARRLARMDFSPGSFTVHFALEGSWPGIPHSMVLMNARFAGLMEDIFEHGVLPQDQLIVLTHPSVTDPSLAPEGKSVFSAAIPVAHQGKLPLDWEQIGPLVEKRILDEIGRRLVPDIHDRIVARFHVTPRDLALEFNAHLGSAWGLEPSLRQSWWLRPHNRDPRIANFYLAGASTHPGAGVPGVLAGAKITAKLMLEELR